MKQRLKQFIREYFPSFEILRRYWKYMIMPPKQYPSILKKFYHKMCGIELDLSNPKRFTEKIQWRKLNDDNIVYSILSDKYMVRKWVENRIGEEYLIPLIGVWSKAEDIDFSKMPESFVLKTNNGCATNIIVRDRKSFNEHSARVDLKIWLKEPFWFNYGFEMHYSRIEPRIIAEAYMKPDNGALDLADYKFFCFRGVPKYCQVIQNRSKEETIDFFDMNWTHQYFVGMNPRGRNSEVEIPIPETFEQMKAIVCNLANGFEFVRVDLYEINHKVYFGEMTFTPGSGIGRFNPDKIDYELGQLWDINTKQVSDDLNMEISVLLNY